MLKAFIRLVILGEGESSSEAEGTAGDFEGGGCLTAFEFAAVGHFNDPGDQFLIKAGGDDFGEGSRLDDVTFEDLVQLIIGGEGILVGLVWFKLGGRGFGYDRGRDYPGMAIDIAGQFINHGFRYVGQGGQAAGHIAVEGAVAGGQFAFIAGGEQEMTEFVA